MTVEEGEGRKSEVRSPKSERNPRPEIRNPKSWRSLNHLDSESGGLPGLNQRSEVRGARPPRAWLDAPSRPASSACRGFPASAQSSVTGVFREGAEISARGGRAPLFHSGFRLNFAGQFPPATEPSAKPRHFGFRISDFGFLSDFGLRISNLRPLLLIATVLLLSASARANSSDTYLSCLTNFEQYAESVWHPATYSNAPPDAGYWGDGATTGNGGIRGHSSVALAYAVLVVARPGDAQTSNRLARIRQALNYDAFAHVTGTNVCVDGKKWGWSNTSSGDWQTPMWAATMGLACLLVQEQLPAATVAGVKRAVASEATHRAAIAPASGGKADTKAEENAWQSNILALGAAWLSGDTNAPAWLLAAKKYLANTYTVADKTGDPLAAWVTTTNCYPDFSIENHNFYHPGYQMVSGMSLGDSWLIARFADTNVAAQLQPFAEHNVRPVWTNLSHVLLDSGDLAFPAGEDWALRDYGHNSYLAWLATHFDDALARWANDKTAQLVRYRQIVNGNGAFVGPSGGGFYREAVQAYRTSMAWLHWRQAEHPIGPAVAPGPDFIHMPDIGIIIQRGSFGFFSICYGPRNGSTLRPMAMIEPPAVAVPTNVFITTPRLPGILGLGALGTATAATLVSLTTNASGFTAELGLTHGSLGTTRVYVNVTGETVALVEVPWPSAGATASAAGSFSVGVENDPLTGGTRRLDWTGGFRVITNRSGASVNATNAWVCVDNAYGLAAGPGGYFNYQANTTYARTTPSIAEAGAAEDTLSFRPADSLAARYAVWFPGKSAAQTAAGAAAITWTISGTNGTLSFPGLGGALQQIAFVLPPPPPAYPPYTLAVATVTASSSQSNYPPTNATDGNLANYWVSLYGPTNHAEWLKVTFARAVALSGMQVYPRTENGGYGPKGIQLFVNVTSTIPASGLPTSGSNAYAASMAATTTLDARWTQPVLATNAVLVITSAYDRGVSTNPRSVQVNEWLLFERAQPGTFGDWAVRQFSDAQLADPTVCGATSDPDGDGVGNRMEFAVGGNPLVADGTNALLRIAAAPLSKVAVRFRERKDMVDVALQFERSFDLAAWSTVTPASISTVTDLGTARWREATFPLGAATAFYRLGAVTAP